MSREKETGQGVKQVRRGDKMKDGKGGTWNESEADNRLCCSEWWAYRLVNKHNKQRHTVTSLPVSVPVYHVLSVGVCVRFELTAKDIEESLCLSYTGP